MSLGKTQTNNAQNSMLSKCNTKKKEILFKKNKKISLESQTDVDYAASIVYGDLC